MYHTVDFDKHQSKSLKSTVLVSIDWLSKCLQSILWLSIDYRNTYKDIMTIEMLTIDIVTIDRLNIDCKHFDSQSIDSHIVDFRHFDWCLSKSTVWYI